jgi:hypothetical protein
MAFADTLSYNPGSGAVTLTRIGMSLNEGRFASADGLINLTITRQNGKRNRYVISVTIQKYSADPTNPALFKPVSQTVREIVDKPVDGFTSAEAVSAKAGLSTLLTASTNANLVKLVGGEV